MTVDTSFDFRSDAGGKDPDARSPTLRRYHQLLWSKPLPNGVAFDLHLTTPGVYLHHRSELGEFWLVSDTVMPSFTNWPRMFPITSLFTAEENDAFDTAAYTMGGMMIFPGNRVGGKMTINGARGFTRRISDRMDLTLECIRRYYIDEPSPLGAVIARYSDFFAPFDNFQGYIEFFLLQDLVTSGDRSVRFFMPFDDFKMPSVPGDVDAYREYRRLSMAFIEARNRRIDGLFGAGGRAT